MTPDDPRHGRRAGYCTGCRCAPCTDAAARYERGRQLDILNGRARLVPAIGAQRRAQALVALGYSWAAIGAYVGMERTNLRRFVTSDQAVMRATLADRFVYTFDALSMRLPMATRARHVRAIREAQQTARAAGWPPPLAWEGVNIDDPAALPVHGGETDAADVDEVVIQRILDGDPTPARTATLAERRAVVAAWTAAGRTQAELGRLTGWKPERYTPSSQEAA